MHIDTQTTPVCVEIEGREYPLAPRTARLMEKLRRVEAAGLREGRPHHRVEMAQLSLLLGRKAVRELFPRAGGGGPRPPRRHLLRCAFGAGSPRPPASRAAHAGAG